MAERSVVTDSLDTLEARALDALCSVLRKHGVVRYERAADGAVKVELRTAADVYEVSSSLHPAPPPMAADPATSRLSAIPPTDPLFDGVEGV